MGLTLHDRLRLWPGGMHALAAAAGVGKDAVSRVANLRHRRLPILVLRRLAQAIRERETELPPELGEMASLAACVEMWREEKAECSESGRREGT